MGAVVCVAGGAVDARGGETATPARWRAVLSGQNAPSLRAVSAYSATAVWAVGQARVGGVDRPVVARWNGRSVRVLRPFSGATGGFNDVEAASPRDVWAVGNLSEAGTRVPLVAHWNGQGWRRVPIPALGETRLTAVTALRGRRVWIAGVREVSVRVEDPREEWTVSRPFVLYGEGGRWHLQDLTALVQPCPYREQIDEAEFAWIWACDTWPSAIAAASPTDVWVVAQEGAPVSAGIGSAVLAWNGQRWTPRRISAPATGMMAVDVAVRAPGDVWALEVAAAASTGDVYRLLRWTRGRARVYPLTGSGANALAAISPSSAWIVGAQWNYPRPPSPRIIHWNGKTAAPQRTSLDNLHNATLESVSAVSATEIWAAGHRLLARYSR